MNRKLLEEALNQISDQHLEEAAAASPRRHLRRWPAVLAAAAILALVVGILAFSGTEPGNISLDFTDPPTFQPTAPATPTEGDIQIPQPYTGTMTPVELPKSDPLYTLASPNFPKMAPFSTEYDAHRTWRESRNAIRQAEEGYADTLDPYFARIPPQILEGTTENIAFSPINIYLGLAMVAETADGTAREQILQLLGAESMEALRKQAEQVWRAHYNNDGLSTCILGSSLWLDSSLEYNENIVKTLAKDYYATVFRGEMGSQALNKVLQDWLNQSTGNLLQQQVADVRLDPETLLALVTTIYYQVQWIEPFSENSNTTGIFHAPGADVEATFMHQRQGFGSYYWGEHFGAIRLSLENQDAMWLILPDAGYTPSQVLAEGEAMEMVLSRGEYPNRKQAQVDLALPKFDVASHLSLNSTLQQLGIRDAFCPTEKNAFPILPDSEVCLSEVTHSTRVTVDEEGVTAAAFTMFGYAAGIPQADVIDFTLDRPFIFVVESRDGLPLFCGVVNNP